VHYYLYTSLYAQANMSTIDHGQVALQRMKVMQTAHYKLISHHLCPYAQRAAIALLENDVQFERLNIDLNNKPDWFLELSPLGKVPVLLVNDETVLFESSVIAEYINDVSDAGLLAPDSLERSVQRAWIEFASQLIANIGRFYSAPDLQALNTARMDLIGKWRRVEQVLGDGPWFGGQKFSLVDAAFAPAFRYFDTLEQLTQTDFFAEVPKVSKWRKALAERASVQNAVGSDYAERLLDFLSARDSVIGKLALKRYVGASRRAA
jgi:glutathione S-transferase